MDAAVHIGVIVALVRRDLVDNGLWLLCRSRAVEIYERMFIDGLRKCRKIVPALVETGIRSREFSPSA